MNHKILVDVNTLYINWMDISMEIWPSYNKKETSLNINLALTVVVIVGMY